MFEFCFFIFLLTLRKKKCLLIVIFCFHHFSISFSVSHYPLKRLLVGQSISDRDCITEDFSGHGWSGQLSFCHYFSFSEKGHMRGADRVMLLIFRVLTFWLLVSWAADQHVRWKMSWLLWWIMSWQQTWVRCPFWIFRACQQLLRKSVVWFLFAHLYILLGRAKSHSVHPSLFGEAPESNVAYDWFALRTWLVLGLFWPPLLVKVCWWSIWVSTVNRGGHAWIRLLFHNPGHRCLASIKHYHSGPQPRNSWMTLRGVYITQHALLSCLCASYCDRSWKNRY